MCDHRTLEKWRVDPLPIGIGLTAILYLVSLFLPACHDAQREESMIGFACIVWFPVNLYFPECWANITLFFSLFVLAVPESPETMKNAIFANERLIASISLTIVSIALALIFAWRTELPIGPAVTNIPIVVGKGYYVWLCSMITLLGSQVGALAIGKGRNRSQTIETSQNI